MCIRDRNASAANTTSAAASRIDVSTGHSTAASLPAASAAGWAASAAGEYVPKGFQLDAIDISAYAASPAPAAPAAELMSTESSVIRAMKRMPNTSHTNAEDHSADPGLSLNTAAVRPHV